MQISDYGIILEMIGFVLMLTKLGPSAFLELYSMKKYGIFWRKKTWKKTPNLNNHKYGIMTLWGRQVPAIDLEQGHHYFNMTKIPDKLHSIGIFLILLGLFFQLSFFNNYCE